MSSSAKKRCLALAASAGPSARMSAEFASPSIREYSRRRERSDCVSERGRTHTRAAISSARFWTSAETSMAIPLLPPNRRFDFLFHPLDQRLHSHAAEVLVRPCPDADLAG